MSRIRQCRTTTKGKGNTGTFFFFFLFISHPIVWVTEWGVVCVRPAVERITDMARGRMVGNRGSNSPSRQWHAALRDSSGDRRAHRRYLTTRRSEPTKETQGLPQLTSSLTAGGALPLNDKRCSRGEALGRLEGLGRSCDSPHSVEPQVVHDMFDRDPQTSRGEKEKSD